MLMKVTTLLLDINQFLHYYRPTAVCKEYASNPVTGTLLTLAKIWVTPL